MTYNVEPTITGGTDGADLVGGGKFTVDWCFGNADELVMLTQLSKPPGLLNMWRNGPHLKTQLLMNGLSSSPGHQLVDRIAARLSGGATAPRRWCIAGSTDVKIPMARYGPFPGSAAIRAYLPSGIAGRRYSARHDPDVELRKRGKGHCMRQALYRRAVPLAQSVVARLLVITNGVRKISEGLPCKRWLATEDRCCGWRLVGDDCHFQEPKQYGARGSVDDGRGCRRVMATMSSIHW